jgi:hypothetical protein
VGDVVAVSDVDGAACDPAGLETVSLPVAPRSPRYRFSRCALLLEQRGEHLPLGSPEVLVVGRRRDVHRLGQFLAGDVPGPVEKAPEVRLLESQFLTCRQRLLDVGDQVLFCLFEALVFPAGE